MTRMKPTCYIAGPMRGKPNYNRAAFNAAAKSSVKDDAGDAEGDEDEGSVE